MYFTIFQIVKVSGEPTPETDCLWFSGFTIIQSFITISSAYFIDDDHLIAHYVIHIFALAAVMLYYFWEIKPPQNGVCKFFKLQFAVRYATFFNHSFKNQIG